jgi:uncharacterized protein YlxP (DUF503 family)
MVVGVCLIDIHLPENSSLKGKRQVMKRILERVKNRFNVSIAEVDDNDLWQRSKIGFSVVGNDRQFINASLDKVLNFIESLNVAEIINAQIEILNL